MLEKSLDVRGGETKTFKIYDWSASHGRMDRELLVQTYSFNYRKRALGAQGKLQFDNWMKPVLICPFFQLGGYRKIDWFHSNGYWWWKRKNWFTIVWSVEFWKTFTEQKVAAVIFISSTSVQRVGYLSKSKICRMAGGEQTNKNERNNLRFLPIPPRVGASFMMNDDEVPRSLSVWDGKEKTHTNRTPFSIWDGFNGLLPGESY